VRIWILGCRGSTPAPGPTTLRYGGHTSAVAVAADDGPPTLLLDAGTGLANLPPVCGGAAFEGAILLTHLHWDHTHGLPFSPATDHPDASVSLYLPAQEAPAEKVLAWAMAPPHFPIGPDGLRGAWSFRDLDEGVVQAGGFEVLAREVPHKGGRTFGYRVTAPDGGSLAYLPDHQPSRLGPGETGFGPVHEAASALADGVDLLVHDAQYTAEEFPRLHHFGHAAVDYAVALGQASDVGQLLAFHHAPTRSDDELDELADRFGSACTFAREGAELVV
jgi:phosphoribosyl 1,2-cyclic phosphodiesterase